MTETVNRLQIDGRLFHPPLCQGPIASEFGSMATATACDHIWAAVAVGDEHHTSKTYSLKIYSLGVLMTVFDWVEIWNCEGQSV